MVLQQRWRISVLDVALGHLLDRKMELPSGVQRSIVLNVLVSDFVNYEMVKLGLLDEADAEELTREYLEFQLDENPAAVIKEAEEWLDVWIWKWKQRVKLVMREDEDLEAARRIEEEVKRIIPLIERYDELKRFVVGSLIRVGEVCFTNTIAESLIKSALFKWLKSYRDHEKLAEIINKNPLLLLNEVIKRVKSLKKFKGYLVVVRVADQVFSETANDYVSWWI